VQVHGDPAAVARAGQRTAVNLTGGGERLERGDTLIEPGRFTATSLIDCELEILPSAPQVRERSLVRFHAWTSETEAEVRLLESTGTLVRLLLRQPILLLPEDRFILRQPSPPVTIGGGRIVDIAPPAGLRRRSAAQRLRSVIADPIGARIRESSYGISADDLIRRTGMLRDALPSKEAWLFDSSHTASMLSVIEEEVAAFHKANELREGISKEHFRSRFSGVPPSFLDKVIACSTKLVVEGDIIRMRSHQAGAGASERQQLDRLEGVFQKAGLAALTLEEAASAAALDTTRTKALVRLLLDRGVVRRAGVGLFLHQSAVDVLKQMVAARRGQRFSVPQFKEWAGVTRKHAIPLLEFLDRERLTRREGDLRVVL
jgi:selenocysteine-specific elongation factor